MFDPMFYEVNSAEYEEYMALLLELAEEEAEKAKEKEVA